MTTEAAEPASAPQKASHIRPARPEDAPVIARMLLSLFLHCKRSASDPFIRHHTPRSTDEIEQWVLQSIGRKEDILLVAEVQGHMAGFVKGHLSNPYLISAVAPRIGHVSMLWVDPSHREQKIATHLLAAIESTFKSHNMRYVDVAYLVGNEDAEKFWPEHGYQLYRKFSVKEL